MKTRIVSLCMLISAAAISAQEIVVDAPSFTPYEGEGQPAPAPIQSTPIEAPTGIPTNLEEPPVSNIESEATPVDFGAAEEGFIIKDAALNDIFQFLARSAGRQYFHNARIAGPEFTVTGHLNDGNPLQQMEELAFMYGLSLHMKGDTIYALTQAQLAQLPSSEFHYQLRYLRPSDIEQIRELVRPMLTPGSGIVNFEPKTNTIIIIDTAHRIEAARNLLHNVDKAKGQIIVETKILRVNSTAAERVGVDWSQSLGAQGVPLAVARDLGSIFGLPTQMLAVNRDPATPEYGFGDTNLVLSPVQMNGVLRALGEGGIAEQVSNPTLITEDNEQATISIIDRVPIITSTVNSTASGSTTTEEVRYKIDTADQSIDQSPDSHREIGISLVVTPTLLPDGTIRMRMRPRSAQIIEEIQTLTGNRYPRVSESMLESLARIPDGHSLIVGGFYGESTSEKKSKVPLLGDVPMLNFFFKNRESIKENTSLVFIVTPTSYDPRVKTANQSASDRLRTLNRLPQDATWADPNNPGPAHEPNMRRTMRGMQPHEAPYYPRAGETAPAARESNRQRVSRGSRRF
ncbi:MAG: type II secretion system protein GspD [Luteolibacter sp.]